MREPSSKVINNNNNPQARKEIPKKSILFNSILRNEGILKSHAKIYPSLAISNDDLENIYFGIKKASKAI